MLAVANVYFQNLEFVAEDGIDIEVGLIMINIRINIYYFNFIINTLKLLIWSIFIQIYLICTCR